MTVKAKPTDPEGYERLTVILAGDSKRVLARLAFERQAPMADIVRAIIDDWLIKERSRFPVGLELPKRLEALRLKRAEKRA